MPAQWHSQPTPALLAEGCMCVYVTITCHLHVCLNDQGLLHATAVTWGQNRHQIRVSTQSVFFVVVVVVYFFLINLYVYYKSTRYICPYTLA